MKKCVICAFTYNLLPDFFLFYDSWLRVAGEPLHVVLLDDLVLPHISHLDNINVHQVSPEILAKWRSQFGSNWPQYAKPLIIQQVIGNCPNDVLMLWLDVDIIIAQPLDPMFKSIERQMLIVQDMFAPLACTNGEQLYSEMGIEMQDANAAVNTGVIGLSFPRDQKVLDTWVKNTMICSSKPHIQDYIAWFDQGVFLWTLQELGLVQYISNNRSYNNPASRNCYEFCTDLVNYKSDDPTNGLCSSPPRLRWSLGDISLGGDTVDEVKLDNPEAIIVHFAGTPKLIHLCQVNHPHNSGSTSGFELRTRSGYNPKTRVICLGPDRWGANRISALVRLSSPVESCVRQEAYPSLAKEAFLKHQGQEYNREHLEAKIKSFKRRDAILAMESNDRLSMFIPELSKELWTTEFLVCLRHPMAMLYSRMARASSWPGVFVPEELKEYRQACLDSSIDPHEKYKLVPPKPQEDLSLAQLHAWEIIEMLTIIFADAAEFCDDRIHVVWAEDYLDLSKQLRQSLQVPLDKNKFEKYCRKYPVEDRKWDDPTENWIKEQMSLCAGDYTDRFMKLLRDNNIKFRPIMQF